MCGRYALGLNSEEVRLNLQHQFPRLLPNADGQRTRWVREQDHRPNFNVAPRSRAPVLRRDEATGETVIETMQWGLIPHWTKHPPTGPLNTINARSETIIDPGSGGMWQSLKGHKRCVVIAQGYYEWQKKGATKVAHFTRLPLQDSESAENTTNSAANHPDPSSPPLILFAGLYDTVKYLSPVESRFKPRKGSPVEGEKALEPYPTGNPLPLSSFTILTTTPHPSISWLHDRMPCVLKTWEEVNRWLDTGDGWKDGKGGTGELLKGVSGLDCYPVQPEVGKVGTNSPSFILPVAERSDGIKAFFSKASPAKSKGAHPSAKPSDSTASGQGRNVKADENVKAEANPEADLKPEDSERLGDDSNAPNPPAAKRKADDDTRKGGKKTKIERKPTSGDKSQPSIASFMPKPKSSQKASQGRSRRKSE